MIDVEVSQLSELHASCDDEKIQVDEKHKKVRSLGDLENDITTLASIAQEQGTQLLFQ